MARIVGGIGVPHTPAFPAMVEREGPGCETAVLFRTAAAHLAALRPDLLLMFDTDHLSTFFLDNLPVFAVGVADSFHGPIDEPPQTPMRTVPSHAALAAHLRAQGIAAGFDLTLVQAFGVDHSVIVPLHFLFPSAPPPVVPVFVNGHVPPLPAAARAHALGAALAAAVTSWPEPLRVAVVGSGSFSLEVHGPRMAPGLPFGVPDPGWSSQICAWLERGDVEAVLAHATAAQIDRAGNVAGELLNWVAMLGALGPRPGAAAWLAQQPQFGHGYAVWECA